MDINKLTIKTFGESKAIHSPIDIRIQTNLTKPYGSYIESTTSGYSRRDKWNKCQLKIREYLNPIVNLSELSYAYPANGIHESLDSMCNKVNEYQIFEGEYRYPTFVKQPSHIAKTVEELLPNLPLYMSNPFSATGNFDERYNEVCTTYESIPVYLDLAFIGTTGEYEYNIYPNVEEVFWSCSKPYGVGVLRAGIRFSRNEEILQREVMGVGYFNHAIIDVFNEVISLSNVFEKKLYYQSQQKDICSQFNLLPSDSFLIGTTINAEWNHFNRENGINRVCLTPAYL